MSAKNWFFAAKGGYNDESHNHNDVGSFMLYHNREPLLIDAGVGTYTSKTFSKDRYSIWTMQSDYHNLPHINGYPQSYGKTYRSSNVNVNDSNKTFSLDISKAYPIEAGINLWQRTYTLSNEGLLLQDTFSIENANVANVLYFMTSAECSFEKGSIRLALKGKSYELQYDKDAFEASIENILLDDKRLSNVWGVVLHRITLQALQTVNTGKYKVYIKELQ